MNRRTYLKNLASAIAGSVLLNHTNTYGALSIGKTVSRIGLQLYTVRKNIERDFEGTLRRVAALGIKEVEFAGYFNQTPIHIRELLKSVQLSAPSVHISTDILRHNLSEAIEAARVIGHKYLVLAYLPEPERKTLDDYQRLIEILNNAGEKCHQAGLQFAYHNHDFEFQRIGDKIPYDLILAETDPQRVKMELDLYWITKAGFDPITYFEKYPGRFPLVHVKDMDNTPKKYFSEVGRGIIDFGKIFSKSNIAGISHYFIEQDESSIDPLESVEISVKYLQALKF